MNNIVISGNQLVQFNSSLFDKFIEYSDVKETTLKSYIVCIRQFMNFLSSNNISQPTRDDIKAYKSYLDNQKFTAGTKAQYLRAVKHFFKWTASEGFYPNIADNIKSAKVRQDNTKKHAFKEDDIKIILESIDRTTVIGKRDYCMVLLSVTGALRIIEMQRANLEDIQIIGGQKVLYIQGKGRDDKDEYKKLVPAVVDAIEDYLACRPTAKKSDPLFVGTSNRAMNARLSEPSISRIIKGVFIRAGFDCSKLTAHSLRHTSNTLLFKAGADLYTVQQHARHSDPKTTEIYIHAVERENDHSEQVIYDRIYNSDKQDFVTKATELFNKLPEEKQVKALELIKQLLQ